MLSEGLREYLCDFGITQLSQARNLDFGSNNQDYWYSTADLNLGGIWKEQWTEFVKGLTHGGIKIGPIDDTLLWMHNKKNGMV